MLKEYLRYLFLRMRVKHPFFLFGYPSEKLCISQMDYIDSLNIYYTIRRKYNKLFKDFLYFICLIKEHVPPYSYPVETLNQEPLNRTEL